MSSQNVLIIGSTGLVGKEILRNLDSQPELSSRVYSLTRREVAGFKPNAHVEQIIEKDTSKWSETITAKLPNVHTLVSSLATSITEAGSLLKQSLIDHDLNVEIAKTAKEELNCDTYILISAIGASSESRVPYLKMKGELEDDIKELKFNKTIILQPGTLLGQREIPKWWGNALVVSISAFIKNWTGYRTLYCVSGEEVGKVVIHLLKESQDYEDGTVKTISPSEVVRIADSLH